MDRKNEGITARKNKLKYKNAKYVKKEPEKPVKKKTNLEDALPCNWAKYEIKESDEDFNEAANFETLLDEPLSEGSHFKFKNEQDWLNTVELHSQFSKYFTLDLKMLSEGISCIPFSKRHDYDDPALQNLDEDTSKKIAKYEAFLNKKYPQKHKKIRIVTKVKMVASENQEHDNNKNTNQIKNKQEVKDLIKIGDEIKTEINNDDIKDDSKKDEVKTNVSMEVRNNAIDNRILNINKKSENKKLDEDLEGLLNLKITDEDNSSKILITDDPLMAPTHVSKNITMDTTDDLEQWLDDILDD